jgi:hypothetical protein
MPRASPHPANPLGVCAHGLKQPLPAAIALRTLANMEYFPIRSFRPLESREDGPDQDRTVLRLCEGLLAYPNGALCTGPAWAKVWGQSGLGGQINSALAAASAGTGKLHFVRVTAGSAVILVVWRYTSQFYPDLNGCSGMWLVTSGNPDLGASPSVTITVPSGTVYRDKNLAARWFGSRIGDRIYFGNGIDANLQWKAGALSALGPASTPSDIYDNSRAVIPPCTTFAMSGNKSVFASGNAAAPKRVWITHPPTSSFPFNEGIYSTDTSFIDVTLSEATRVTALSAFQNYITAHTDAKPVNLYDVDGATDGFKCVQAPSAANSSAPSPECVRDINGLSSFYVGADGEIYKDEAIRVGPHDKRPARDQDIVTSLSQSDWNRDMKKPVTLGAVHTAYDRRSPIFWLWAEHATFTGARMCLWAFNEGNRTVTGPFRAPDADASTVVGPDAPGALVIVMTSTGEMLFADLAAIGETEQFLLEAQSTPLGSEYAETDSAPTPTAGLGYVAMTADLATIAESVAGSRIEMATPWSTFTAGGSYTFTKFWNDAYVARFETGYLDFGDARLVKNYLEVALTWQRHSRAYVGIYAETDDGRRGGKWLGLAFNKETQRVPLNLSGRRIRVRVVIVAFNSGKALLRDVTIGWGPQGTT